MKRLIRYGLLKWQLLRIAPLTAVAVLIACVSVIGRRTLLTGDDPWAIAFIIAHSIGLVLVLWWFKGPSKAFLYTRGYSRNQLWWNTQLATWAGVLACWIPCAVLIWSRMREQYQDRIVRNALFPLFANVEISAPLYWLGVYALAIPLIQYAQLRGAQNSRGTFARFGLFAILAVAAYCGPMGMKLFGGWNLPTISLISAAVVSVLIGGFLLHRNAEVRG